MNRRGWICLAGLLIAASTATPLFGQFGNRAPDIGYVYPAGACRGGEVDILIGGQILGQVNGVYVTGEGVTGTIGKLSKPMNGKERNEIRDAVQKVRERIAAERKEGVKHEGGYRAVFVKYVTEKGVTAEKLLDFEKEMKDKANPKRQLNPQLVETLAVHLTIAPDAAPGLREMRLLGPGSISNPVWFHVGNLQEWTEDEPEVFGPHLETVEMPMPFVINGQTMPGDVDRFRFRADKGQRVLVSVAARSLMPYLADAVPGWFQATVAVLDANGREVAYADDYHFDPDPVLFYTIPAEGDYIVEIKDAIYRGREDFVYRVTVGELPFVTGIFPLGVTAGQEIIAQAQGWNLPTTRLKLDATATKGLAADIQSTGTVQLAVGDKLSNPVRFAIDTLPDCMEQSSRSGQQSLALPTIVNGRIDPSGDADVYRIHLRADETVSAEVYARRLGSPLDAMLTLTSRSGKVLAFNDDRPDQGSGLSTHHADPALSWTATDDGDYLLQVSDTQQQGSPMHAYRLHVGTRGGGFELRVVPSGIAARPGTTLPITVYALRHGGFNGDIRLSLKDAPEGFVLNGPWAPAGQDKIRLSLTLPPTPFDKPVALLLEGVATIDGREMRRLAGPSEDMEQAFIYRHLVPTAEWLVWASGNKNPAIRILGDEPAYLIPGQTTPVLMAMQKWIADRAKLELSDPPAGVTLAKVEPVKEGLLLHVQTDAAKAKVGVKGNLIVNVFNETPGKAEAGKPPPINRRRVGILPAVAFQIVEK